MGDGRVEDRRTDRTILGGGSPVLPRQPSGDDVHAVQLLHAMDGLRDRTLRRVPYPCHRVLRGQPGGDEPAPVEAHRKLGEVGEQPIQRDVEIQHVGLQVLRVQPRADGEPLFPGVGAIRGLPRRAVASVIRSRGGVPGARSADIPAHRRGQDCLHRPCLRLGGLRLARGQELLRVRRKGAAEDRRRPALSILEDSREAGPSWRHEHPQRHAGDFPGALPSGFGAPRQNPDLG